MKRVADGFIFSTPDGDTNWQERVNKHDENRRIERVK